MMHRFSLFSVAATATGLLYLTPASTLRAPVDRAQRSRDLFAQEDQYTQPWHPGQECWQELSWPEEEDTQAMERDSRSLTRSLMRRQRHQQLAQYDNARHNQHGYAQRAEFQHLPASLMASRGGAAAAAWEATAIEDLCHDGDWVGLRILADLNGVSEDTRKRANDLLAAHYGYASAKEYLEQAWVLLPHAQVPGQAGYSHTQHVLHDLHLLRG
jgi:hypothetical protein